MPEKIQFTKMHGLGNDFVVIRTSGQQAPEPGTIRKLADRKTGIGFDQLLWLEPARNPGADIFYRVFNADGSPAEQCGNGARCIARWLADRGAETLKLEHAGGIVDARLESNGNIAVDMGIPEFDPPDIPFRAAERRPAYTLDAGGTAVEVRVVSIGNPHAVVTVEQVDSAPVGTLGPLLENHDRFPNRANIGFMQVVSAGSIRLRVYERGAGETQGCGTGACAAVVTGISAGQLTNQVNVELPGGRLGVSWEGPGTTVWLTGEAVTVFEGMIEA